MGVIEIMCPNCDRLFSFEPKIAGHNLKCSRCKGKVNYEKVPGLKEKLSIEDVFYLSTRVKNGVLEKSKGKQVDVFIPDDIKIIGPQAFEYCSKIKSVTFPDNVKIIDFAAFCYCNKLETVKFGKGVKTIGTHAFMGTNLKKLSLPSNIEIIDEFAFNGAGLEEITFEEGLKRVGKNAFSSLKITNVILPSTLEYIGSGVFARCRNLENIEIREGNKYYKCIDGNLYSIDGKKLIQYACGKKEEEFTVPDDVEVIWDRAFEYAENLKKINLPKNLKAIGENAFSYTGIREVIIPSEITELVKNTFTNCKALERVELNDKIRRIRWGAFSNCSSLTSIVIPDSVQILGSVCFCECENLKNVQIGNGVKEIEGSAFSGCSSLVEIIIPENVKKIDSYAFSKCPNLTHVKISNKIVSVHYKAFSDSSNVKIDFDGTPEEWQEKNSESYGSLDSEQLSSVLMLLASVKSVR